MCDSREVEQVDLGEMAIGTSPVKSQERVRGRDKVGSLADPISNDDWLVDDRWDRHSFQRSRGAAGILGLTILRRRQWLRGLQAVPGPDHDAKGGDRTEG